RASTTAGSAFYIVNPARRTRIPAFDQARLAAGLGAATNTTVEGDRLPFQSFDLAADGRSLTVTVRSVVYACDLTSYACSRGPQPPQAPPSSSKSPDGKWAAFIRDHNLWVKELASGTETQLTTDGIRDFGYATNNAGWVHGNNPILTW